MYVETQEVHLEEDTSVHPLILKHSPLSRFHRNDFVPSFELGSISHKTSVGKTLDAKFW